MLDLQAFDTCIIWMTCYFPLRKCSCAYYIITVHGASRPICCLWVQSQEFCYLHQTLLECYVIHHPRTENSLWVLWFRKVSLKPVHNYRCPHLNDMKLCIHFINVQMRHSRWVLASLSICTAFKSKFPEVLTIIHWLFFWNLWSFVKLNSLWVYWTFWISSIYFQVGKGRCQHGLHLDHWPFYL